MSLPITPPQKQQQQQQQQQQKQKQKPTSRKQLPGHWSHHRPEVRLMRFSHSRHAAGLTVTGAELCMSVGACAYAHVCLLA